jgi:hypothetical protein
VAAPFPAPTSHLAALALLRRLDERLCSTDALLRRAHQHLREADTLSASARECCAESWDLLARGAGPADAPRAP